MDDSANESPSRATRLLAYSRLVYTELQYWLVGLSPEGYHSAQASAWEDLGNFNRAAKHVSAYLENTEKPQMRAFLAYCFARTERWADAAREYAAVIDKWPHPSVALGLAEARFMLGEVAEAHRLLASVEHSNSPLDPAIAHALALLKTELAAASNQ